MSEIMFADGLISEEELRHFGIPKKSGRYPWGSGENPYHHGASAPGGKSKKDIKREAKAAKRAEKEKIKAQRKKEREIWSLEYDIKK